MAERTSTQVQPGTPPSPDKEQRNYESFLEARREQTLERVREGYEEFQRSRTYRFPTWLYGPAKGTLFRVECEDSPRFGENSYLEFDSARTAFISIDWQVDFCGEKGYVDVMGYELELTARAIEPTRRALDAVRQTDIQVIHLREGHLPDLSDAPYNKLLRSKIIGKNAVGIGEEPEDGIGRLLVRGSRSWAIVEELEPIEGEILIDKAGKGVLGVSTFFYQLQNLGITHLVITGITTDVCFDTVMTQANDMGYWCLALRDCTGATDEGNYEAAIKSIKMQGGVFGWVSDSAKFLEGLREGGLVENA
jgi:nicotinamidase-related amidase